jgi:enoyl-CoA hydratase/carnithine racemase
VPVGALVRLEVSDGVGTLRLDRPPMNVLSVAAQDELAAAAADVAGLADVRAVVVTGGPRVFSTGADVEEMARWDYTDAVDRSRALQAAFTAVAAIPQPTVAAVAGFALGGGCELALCCDVRVAGDNARLGLPEIRLGIMPGAGGTQRLPRLVGPARAKELIFTGRFVGADEARAIGLVDQVVPPDEVEAAARAWAAQFVDGPAYALRAAKQAVDVGMEVDVSTGLEIERTHFAGLFATQDRGSGMESFLREGPGTARFVGR